MGVHIRNVWGADLLPGISDGPGHDVFTSFDLAAVPTRSWEEVTVHDLQANAKRLAHRVFLALASVSFFSPRILRP